MKKTIKAYCKVCLKERNFHYYKPQYYKGRRMFDIYLCEVCKTTKAFNKTKQYEKALSDLEKKIENEDK